MADSPTDAEARAALEGGLRVRRNAIRGFAVGGVVAAAVLSFFVLLPGAQRPVALYVGLAVVLSVSIGLLATVVLVGWRMRQLSKRL